MNFAGMSIVEVGQLLSQAQRELADAALAAPAERTEFEYGRVSGIHSGLGLAWELIKGKHQEQQDRDDKL